MNWSEYCSAVYSNAQEHSPFVFAMMFFIAFRVSFWLLSKFFQNKNAIYFFSFLIACAAAPELFIGLYFLFDRGFISVPVDIMMKFPMLVLTRFFFANLVSMCIFSVTLKKNVFLYSILMALLHTPEIRFYFINF